MSHVQRIIPRPNHLQKRLNPNPAQAVAKEIYDLICKSGFDDCDPQNGQYKLMLSEPGVYDALFKDINFETTYSELTKDRDTQEDKINEATKRYFELFQSDDLMLDDATFPQRDLIHFKASMSNMAKGNITSNNSLDYTLSTFIQKGREALENQKNLMGGNILRFHEAYFNKLDSLLVEGYEAGLFPPHNIQASNPMPMQVDGLVNFTSQLGELNKHYTRATTADKESQRDKKDLAMGMLTLMTLLKDSYDPETRSLSTEKFIKNGAVFIPSEGDIELSSNGGVNSFKLPAPNLTVQHAIETNRAVDKLRAITNIRTDFNFPAPLMKSIGEMIQYYKSAYDGRSEVLGEESKQFFDALFLALNRAQTEITAKGFDQPAQRR